MGGKIGKEVKSQGIDRDKGEQRVCKSSCDKKAGILGIKYQENWKNKVCDQRS